ncbi:MAG: ATP-binding protein [Acetobacteraceae bacterium]|jgi:signal transduction histidine kinase/ActR/RegA family two-component response regulator
MDPSAGADKALRAELGRLRGEHEQALVSLEDAQNEISALVRERDALAAAGERHLTAWRSAEASAGTLRANLADAMEMLIRQQASAAANSATDEELAVAFEEAQTLAEELAAANDALTRSNHDLDCRVAERTSALDEANRSLELINADLQRRVDEETAARQEAQSRLFQSQKLEAIGQLTGGIAHDFNNLLTVITSSTQFLQRADDPARRARLVHRIEEAAWRGADLTRRLLAFGRRQPLRPDRVELAIQAVGLTELLRHTLREDIQIQMQFDNGVWPAEADVAALELALLNLVVNSRDAMPNGGQIVVTARNTAMRNGQSARWGLAEGDYVEICVTDTGMGMPPDVLERVFEPFFTTKEPGKGTGLGLAQVYGFVKQSGGTAWVESHLGRGTSVHLLLPRSLRERGGEATQGGTADVRTPHDVGPISILVVEDNEDVAAAVIEMLVQLGHEATHVGSVGAALGVISGDRPIDLVFTDVLLPGGGSGLDLARELTQRKPDVPVVLTSGYGGGVTGRLAAANLPFLRKPYRIEALKMTIEEALGQHAQSEHVQNH